MGLEQWPEKDKIKLEEEAISEIMVADTNSESGAEAGDVEEYFEEEEHEEEEDDNNHHHRNSHRHRHRHHQHHSSSKPHQKSNHRLQQVADYQPGDHLKNGKQIFILLSVQQKVWKSEGPHINKHSSPLSVLMFFTEIFICWWNRPTYTTTNTSDRPDVAAHCLTLWLSLP